QRPYKKAPPSDVGGARLQGVCCAPCRSLRTALKGRSVVYAYNEFYRLEMQYVLLLEYFYAIKRNDTERRAQLPTVGRSIPSAAGARVPKKRRAACDSSRNVALFRTVGGADKKLDTPVSGLESACTRWRPGSSPWRPSRRGSA